MLYPAELRGPDGSNSRVSVWRNIGPQGRKADWPPAATRPSGRMSEEVARRQRANKDDIQFNFSGGATGNGRGATGTPSSIRALASARLACPWIRASSRSP